MKTQLQYFICFMIVILLNNSCGNNENDPQPIDCDVNPIIVLEDKITKTNCDNNTGMIEISAIGGSGDYEYSVDDGSNFQSTGVFTNLGVGVYKMVVKDEFECSSSISISIEDIGSVVLVVDNKTDTPCGSAIGEISVSSTGASGDVKFRLDNGIVQDTGLFTGLTNGVYVVHAIEVSSGCESVEEVEIAEIGGISISIEKNAEAGCESSNGQLTVNATGGNNQFEYSLDNVTFQTSNVFTNLSKSNYTITVKDSNGCDNEDSIEMLSGVSFASSIKSIIDNNCAISGCHVSGTGRSDLSVFSNIRSNANSIRTRTQSGNMPRDGELAQDEIDLIACWIDDGALNN